MVWKNILTSFCDVSGVVGNVGARDFLGKDTLGGELANELLHGFCRARDGARLWTIAAGHLDFVRTHTLHLCQKIFIL